MIRRWLKERRRRNTWAKTGFRHCGYDFGFEMFFFERLRQQMMQAAIRSAVTTLRSHQEAKAASAIARTQTDHARRVAEIARREADGSL